MTTREVLKCALLKSCPRDSSYLGLKGKSQGYMCARRGGWLMWEHGCSEGLFLKTLFKRRGREGEKERDRQIGRFIVLDSSNAEKFKAKIKNHPSGIEGALWPSDHGSSHSACPDHETLARRLPFLGLSLPTCEMGSTPARPPPPTFVRISELTERVNSSDSVNSFLTDISLCTYTHGYM